MGEPTLEISETPSGSEERTGEELVEEGEIEKSLLSKTAHFIQKIEFVEDGMQMEAGSLEQNILEARKNEEINLYEKLAIFEIEIEKLVNIAEDSLLAKHIINIGNKYSDAKELGNGVERILEIIREIKGLETPEAKLEEIEENLKERLKKEIDLLNEESIRVFVKGRRNIKKGNELKEEWYKTHKTRKIPESEIKNIKKFTGPEGERQLKEYNKK